MSGGFILSAQRLFQLYRISRSHCPRHSFVLSGIIVVCDLRPCSQLFEGDAQPEEARFAFGHKEGAGHLDDFVFAVIGGYHDWSRGARMPIRHIRTKLDGIKQIRRHVIFPADESRIELKGVG